MTDAGDLLALHRRAVAHDLVLVEAVTSDQLDDPTPCPDWDVAALIGHLIMGNHLYAHCARGARADTFDFATVAPRDHLAMSYAASADDVDDALADESVLTATFSLPFADVSGQQAVALHFVDLIAHGWDLATATGQYYPSDDDIVLAALDHADMPDDFRGEGRPFGLVVETDAEASDLDRFIAILGRDPAWGRPE